MLIWTKNKIAKFHQKIQSGCLKISKIRQGITFFCRTLYCTCSLTGGDCKPCLTHLHLFLFMCIVSCCYYDVCLCPRTLWARCLLYHSCLVLFRIDNADYVQRLAVILTVLLRWNYKPVLNSVIRRTCSLYVLSAGPMALNGLYCADVPLSNYSLTPRTHGRGWIWWQRAAYFQQYLFWRLHCITAFYCFWLLLSQSAFLELLQIKLVSKSKLLVIWAGVHYTVFEIVEIDFRIISV